MEKYGRFSEDDLEFIIDRPDTPAPWINFTSNGKYTRLISNTGGGYAYWQTPRLHRITRHRYNSMPVDRPGHYLYVRDRKTGDYWSPSWQPCATKLDKYECRHGLNYTRITGQQGGVEVSVLTFVPEGDDLELWRVTATNTTKEKKSLDFFPYVELCIGNALNDLVNQANDQHFNDVFLDDDSQILYATKRYWNTFGSATVEQSNVSYDRYYFFASDLNVSAFDGSKNEFIGRWRSEENPEAVEKGKCGNTAITAGDAVAALQLPLDLKPGESKEFVIMLGLVPREHYKRDAAKLVKKYRDLKNTDAAYEKLVNDWRDYISCVKVETPDKNLNTMINVWNQWQTACTFRFSRDAGYYHGGLLFGRGFRDSCQDTFGPLMTRPEWVRQRLSEMSTHQFKDGSVVHCYFPVSGGYARTGHSDTPLWLPMAVTMYLRETGDYAFLDDVTPYQDEGEATILKHIYGTLDFTLKNLTERNLPKFGPGDWNDTLDYMGRKGKGESVWNAQCLCYVLRDIVELAKRIGDKAAAKRYQAAYDKVAKAINDLCWDGEWYIVGTNDLREEVGSKKNKECKIYLNTQTWAVMSGVASPERAAKAMASAKKYLDTPKGPKLLDPAFRTVNENIGLATRCVPGKKENAAVFNHPVSWAVLAEAMLGNGDQAYEYYKKALPMNPVVDIDRYEMEPYVYSEYVTSPDHPTFGQASHAWLTGSSTWMLRDVIDYIIGVRPNYDGLVVDPCVPKDWKNFKMTRKFRGRNYEFTFSNPKGVSKGVESITVNGAKLDGNVIEVKETAKSSRKPEVVKVEVVMG
ncbi:glycosyl transferase family 36 [candidate division BRC1 bacterium HGW-BRC1-1]|nr:MAG: glycosyl transferase family 36 [candidate division BRC1 bacterium HGW-BRC1-1]